VELQEDPAISVIGLGNLLQLDDGFGPRVVQWIEEHCVTPPGVEFVDVGTAGLHILRWVIGRKAVIFLDAVTGGGTPGQLYVYQREQVLAAGRPSGPRFSPHQPEVREILRMAEVADAMPEVVMIIGVEPVSMDDGLGLSAIVEAMIEPTVERLREELARLGVTLVVPAKTVSASA